MTALRKGLLLAAIHLVLVLSLGGKLLFDRATRPRAWVKAAPVDPSLPIRGRYVSLRVEVPVTGFDLPPVTPRPARLKDTDLWPPRGETHTVQVELSASASGLVARNAASDAKGGEGHASQAFLPAAIRSLPREQWTVTLREPLAFFLPEHGPDPSRRPAGEELWVEVTLPRKGPLRPIRLGVKKDGVLRPLDL
jgi:hypothetical protein